MINQFYIDYIKAIENPDRVGWNGKVWTAPQYKGYDKNQRGYGIDIVKNDSAKRLTQNRPGQWLTEGEADKLMREHLLYVYGAAQKHIEGFDNLSDRRKAALLGMLYRGDSVNKNRHIIDINEPDDNKFFESISNYYRSKGLNERAKNSSDFFSNNQLTNFLIPMKWEQWEPPMKFKSGGQVRKMQTASGGPILLELNWDAHDWLSKRVDKPVGLKYTQRDVEIFNSHIPEYQQIEKEAKANGTWLKMPDGSTWEGDPRAWVMMQSKAYKKNYSSTPWYTGLAQWPTTYNYGYGSVETDKLTRAPYYNGLMWFSNNKGYGDVFAHVIDSHGYGPRAYERGEENIKGHNFLSAIPKEGNYRHLQSPQLGTYDYWAALPYVRTQNGIERVIKNKNNKHEFKGWNRGENKYFPEGDKSKAAKTDDVVNWSKELGDQGIFMNKVYDGPTRSYLLEDGSWHMIGESSLEESINEFISLPGFTNKVKFIEGNNGDFDIDNPYKYAYNFKKLNNGKLYAKRGGKMNILEFLKNGSGIHIKEKNKGKFTSYCGGKVTDECILKGKNSSNPAIRKRATFAANARKWKHKEGGVLKAQFGLPLILSPENIKEGFNFVKQGLGKIWDIVNTPITGSSGVSVQLPNGNLLNIPGTLGGAPEILPGRMDKGVLLIEKHAPNFFKLINEFPTLAKNLVLGNVKLFKEFFRTGNKDLLKWFETKSDFMLRTPNSKSTITPKGFTKGNEVAPTSGTQPISETGLNIRETRLGNMNNPPRNPSEKLAVEDWNTMNPDNTINPLLPTGRPSYKIELDGLKIDIRYPKLTTAKKIKTDYTQSGTSLERAVEGKRYGIPRKGRVSSNDRNARAMESGDARTTNAGYTNVKKGQIKLVENNLDKYPEYERKALEQKLLRLYRKNRPESEINKVKREFYKYLARRYGYFKIGGVIKANTGIKFNWNSALNTGVNLMGQFLPSIIGGGNNLSYSLGNNNYSDIMANTALLYMLNQQLENEVLNNYDKIMSKLHFDPSNPNANGGSIVKNHINYLAQAPVLAGLKEFNDNYKKFLDEQVKLRKTNYITNALTNTLLTGFDIALNYKPTTKKGSSVS